MCKNCLFLNVLKGFMFVFNMQPWWYVLVNPSKNNIRGRIHGEHGVVPLQANQIKLKAFVILKFL